MPSRTYALEPGGPQRLELTWDAGWKNVQVKLDRKALGSRVHASDLMQGCNFRTPEGKRLKVQLEKARSGFELVVKLDGVPLPDSAPVGDSSGAEPSNEHIRTAIGVMYFVAGANLLAGLAAAGGVEFLSQMGFGIGTAVIGLVFGVLAVVVHLLRSQIALGIGIALLTLDGLYMVVLLASGALGVVTGLFMRVLFIIALVRGFIAVGAAGARGRRLAQEGPPATAPSTAKPTASLAPAAAASAAVQAVASIVPRTMVGAPPGGMVRSIRVIGTCMIVQGLLEVAYGALLVAYVVWRSTQAIESLEGSTSWLVAPLVVATLSIAVGFFRLAAGRSNRQFTGRGIGIAAMVAGVLTAPGLLCLPTALVLCAAGLVVYLSDEGVMAFAWGESGCTVQEVLQAAAGKRREWEAAKRESAEQQATGEQVPEQPVPEQRAPEQRAPEQLAPEQRAPAPAGPIPDLIPDLEVPQEAPPPPSVAASMGVAADHDQLGSKPRPAIFGATMSREERHFAIAGLSLMFLFSAAVPLTAFMTLGGFFSMLLDPGLEGASEAQQPGYFLGMLLALFADFCILAAQVFSVYGAWNIYRQRRHPLAAAAAVIAVVPFVSPFLVVGIPFGIWALTILFQESTKAAFTANDVRGRERLDASKQPWLFPAVAAGGALSGIVAPIAFSMLLGIVAVLAGAGASDEGAARRDTRDDCASMDNEIRRDFCYRTKAKRSDDQRYCRKIRNPERRRRCYRDVRGR